MADIVKSLLVGLTGGCLLLAATGCTKHRDSADRYFTSGQYERAAIEYLNVLRQNPGDPVAIERLGTIYYEEGQVGRAFAFLSKAKELQPTNTAVRLKLGSLYLSARKFKEAQDEAIFVLAREASQPEALTLLADTAVTTNLITQVRQQLERLRAQTGDNTGLHLAFGAVAWRQQNPREAEAQFKQALALDPKSSAAQFALGNLFWAQTNLASAEQAFKAAAELAPIRSSRRLRYAEFRLKTGAREEARQFLENITKQAPDYVPAWNLQAQVAFEEKKYDVCSTLLQQALAHDPDNFEAIALRSRLKLVQGDAAKALTDLNLLQSKYPNTPQVYYQLGLAHLMNKDLDKAITSLNQARALDTNDVDALHLLAQIQIAKGDAASAVTSLTPFLRQHPEDERGQLYLARAYLALGRPEDALTVYRNLMKLPTRNPEPPFLAGMLLRQQKRLPEARSMFAKALEFSTDYLPAISQLVELDLQDKKVEAATQRVQALIAKYPKAPEPEFLLARVYEASGQPDQEEAALLKALTLDPNDRIARDLYLALAKFYVRMNRQQQAIDRLEENLKRNPKDTMALLLMATIYTQSANYAKAGETYERLLAANPQSGPALNNYAYLCSENLGRLDKAQQLAQKARAAFPQDATIADTFGWILYRQGNYSAALPLIQEAAEKLANDAEVQCHLGLTRYMLGQQALARTALQRSLELSTNFPGRMEAQQRLALLSSASGGSSSLAELEKELTARPNDTIVLLRLGAAYEQQAAWDKARDAYQKAWSLNSQSAPAAAGLARLFVHFQNSGKALEYAKKARDLAPDDSRTGALLGHLLLQSGDQRWALSLLQESARALPQDAAVRYDLAWAQFGTGQPNEAQISMQQAVQLGLEASKAGEAKRFLVLCNLCNNPSQASAAVPDIQAAMQADPTYGPALVAAALLQEQQPDVVAARKAWEAVLGALPQFVLATKHLASLYAQAPADYQKAYDLALKARAAFPDDPEVAKTLGTIAYQRRDYAGAVQLLNTSVRRRANDAELFYYLGMAHYQLRQPRESKAALQKALELNLSSPLAAEAKKTLATMQ